MTDSTGTDVVVSTRGLSKKFCRDYGRSLRYAVADVIRDLMVRPQPPGLRRDEFWALHDVSFEVRRGENVGVMGANGAGKSTLLRLLLGTLRLTEGDASIRGRVASLTEHGIGFDPMLTGRQNAYLGAAVLGIDRRVVDAFFGDIVAFAELEDFIDAPVRFYSTGMRARLGFAIAMYLEPDILLVDEVLAVGDIGFQRRCMEHVRTYLDSGGSLLLVSHNPLMVQSMCDRCLVLDGGSLVSDGDVVGGVGMYCRLVQGVSGDGAVARSLADPSGITLREEGFPAQQIDVDNAAGEPPIGIEQFGIRAVGETIVTLAPATVFVRFRCVRPTRVRWGFCLLTEDLTTTITCEGRLDPFVLPAGSGELSGTVARLPLAAGSYALRVAIMDPTTDLPVAMRGYRDSPHYFSVDVPVSARSNYRQFARDLVVLEDVTWKQPDSIGADATGKDAASEARMTEL